LLHGVHPAEATDAVLLQFYGIARIGIGASLLVKLLAPREQGKACFRFSHR
jgi:hypothetical protein